jgi:hypothetical protein
VTRRKCLNGPRCESCRRERGDPNPLPPHPPGQTCRPDCGCAPGCDCPLCWLAGHRGPVPPEWPTARNPARQVEPEPETEAPTLFDEVLP